MKQVKYAHFLFKIPCMHSKSFGANKRKKDHSDPRRIILLRSSKISGEYSVRETRQTCGD